MRSWFAHLAVAAGIPALVLACGALPACGTGRAPAAAHPEPTVVERVAFRADSGGPKRLFQPDEHILAEVDLPAPLDTYRDFDDDPDIPLSLMVEMELRYPSGGSSSRGGATCILPRKKLRHRNRFAVAIFANPMLELDPSVVELRVGGTGEAGCTDIVRGALQAISRETLPTAVLSVRVTVEYTRSDGTEAPLAFGHFDIDVADHAEAARRFQSLLASEAEAGRSVFRLPPQPRPDGEAAILAGMKKRYPDPSYLPIRAVPLAADWTVSTSRRSTWASLDVWVVFRRDTGTCVARFFKLETGPYIRNGPPVTAEDPHGRRVPPEETEFTATRHPERDREMLCEAVPAAP